MEGKVKWFDRMKRFGFIEGEDGKDYFVHETAVQDENRLLAEEEEVTFEPVETDKGWQAQQVQRV